ncbi:hypothetical protein [Neobacillus sp. 19]|uniref:hypothetical protein n=1 Tax=Neobacillus sp. 19 TaxID=3394458 RepID=UPI003BF71720
MKKVLFTAFLAFIFTLCLQAPASAAIGRTCADYEDDFTLMMFWTGNGFSATNDPYNLDDDKDGYPCWITKENNRFHRFVPFPKWIKMEDGYWYYYLEVQTPYKGWIKDKNTWYFLDYKTGIMKTGWLQQGGKWYFLSSSGAMKTGWAAVGGVWYYFDASGAMKTGWVKDGGAWYYLEKSGAMRTAPLTVGATTYYFNSSGAMKTGWIQLGRNWYYYGENGPMKGWVKDGGTWYFLDPKGVMKTGWVYTGGSWYYLNMRGGMRTGWLEHGSGTYYLDPSGAMVTGWKSIGTNKYYFYPSGVMAVNTVINGEKIGPDGTWIPNDALLVKVSEIARKYDVAVNRIEAGEYQLVANGKSVGWASTKGLTSAKKQYADLTAELAILLGIPTTIETLRADIETTLFFNFKTVRDQYLINCSSDTDTIWIEWGEYLKEMNDLNG